jgi:hypothetical protein
MPKQVIVPTNISLRSETLEALTANVRDVSPSEVISNRATQCLETIASGGVLLTPDQVAEIEKAGKTTVNRGQDIVSAVQKGHGISEGAAVFPIKLDPEFLGPLQLRADECGRTMQDLMNDMVDIGLENNWVYGLSFDGQRRTFSPSHEKFFTEITGIDNFTVADIEAAIREIQRPKRKKTVEEPETVGA